MNKKLLTGACLVAIAATALGYAVFAAEPAPEPTGKMVDFDAFFAGWKTSLSGKAGHTFSKYEERIVNGFRKKAESGEIRTMQTPDGTTCASADDIRAQARSYGLHKRFKKKIAGDLYTPLESTLQTLPACGDNSAAPAP